jgi:hypothetical protein
MTNLISGVHLRAEEIDSPDIMNAIESSATWVVTSKEWDTISTGLDKCVDEKREKEFLPLLNAIGFGGEDVRYGRMGFVDILTILTDFISSSPNNDEEKRHRWNCISSANLHKTRNKTHDLQHRSNN